MIRAPWSVNAENFHVVIKLKSYVDFSQRAISSQLERPKLVNLTTDKMIISMARMRSTRAEDHEVVSHEAIFKMIVEHRGKQYAHPIITFVDNEFALIRGFLLGFQKLFGRVSLGESLHLNSKLGNFSANCHRAMDQNNIPSTSYPFLLERNFDFGNGLARKGLVTLATTGYHKESDTLLECKITEFGVLDHLGLTPSDVANAYAVACVDAFSFSGVVDLE